MTLTWKRVTETLFADTAWPRTVAYWVGETGPTDLYYYVIERGYAAYEGYTGYTTWRLPRTVEFWDKGEDNQLGYGAEDKLAQAKAVAEDFLADVAAWRAYGRAVV